MGALSSPRGAGSKVNDSVCPAVLGHPLPALIPETVHAPWKTLRFGLALPAPDPLFGVVPVDVQLLGQAGQQGGSLRLVDPLVVATSHTAGRNRRIAKSAPSQLVGTVG